MKQCQMVIGLFAALTSLVASASMEQKYPVQTEQWQQTKASYEREDMLEKHPATVILWAGSAYAKEFHSPRGHQFAVTDVSHTLRTGVAPEAGEKGMSASCWTCKTPQAWQLMQKHGEQGYAGANFTDFGSQIEQVVYCSDCHQGDKGALALPRPHAKRAMEKVQLPFAKQKHSMQASQTCGQCHVTYYFQPEASNQVNIPWIFGNTVDEIEKYYDTRRFYEWIHPISQTPMLKARHPEFEHWSRSKHAAQGVGCVDCHMAASTDGSPASHKVGGAWELFDSNCTSCHTNKEKTKSKLEANKAWVEQARTKVEDLLVKAHYEAKAAWDAGATWPQMNTAIMAIRHSQWRWDFAVSSHGVAAHNPQEAKALLNKSLEQVSLARVELAKLLATLKVDEVEYPDYSSKASAQKAIGLDMPALNQQKQDYIKATIEKQWQPVANVKP
ncbi:ammonia-forming cytochrome c nitrite reductase subunit c552 [Paraferrimonas sedimenticola]|uniref:nitrite reductase (cytochrome; ammonia-forming) n=1 Tax=Paraferrimonas sedimenticola TaxID=375674 RepID=A0AA37W1P5_9GAMM|nr:ammonia-forming cytochrome c nitrite reductase subunit c552 [Paraferrimonas sedimenticola]GLP96552.1 cytochrome c-552 [Paraferrimonas sedimenticola]